MELVEPCLIWEKSRYWNGYGRAWRAGKVRAIHRWTWEEANGPIPKGLVVRHRCDNPACYRLSHLQIGTQGHNMLDKARRGRASSRYGRVSDATVASVRQLLGSLPQREIAKRCGVSQCTVSDIALNKGRFAWPKNRIA